MTPEQELNPGPAPQPVLTVAAVARRLGVAPSTLRTWDRRYGLGPSAHTAGSHRRYGPGDLHRLSVMRGLTLEGVPPAEAAQIALSSASADAPPPDRALITSGLSSEQDSHTRSETGTWTSSYTGSGIDTEIRDAHSGHRFAVGLGSRRGVRLAGMLGATGPAAPLRPRPSAVADTGRGSAVWITDEPVLGAPFAVMRSEAPGTAVGPVPAGSLEASADALLGARALLGAQALLGPIGASRSGGGRVLSLPDASPRARGLARAAMALDTFQLTRLLRDAVAGYGVVGTWESMIIPVLQGVGERWRSTGEGVDVEHAFCEAVLCVLRGVTVTLYWPRNIVPVLLACADGDHHSLPLHVMAAALAEEEVGCRMLGAGVPSTALVAAVRRTGPGVVFLYARLPVVDVAVLRDLPRQRPAPRVLVGGPGWADVALPVGVARVDSLTEALAAVIDAARI